ncbi:MmgE/PrpD family protein [Chloroflexota bacterium]
MGASATLAKYGANLSFDKLPPNVVQAAKERILDTIGVATGGSQTEHVRQVVNFVRMLGGREEARIIGTNMKTNMPNAALANGVMAHSIDFDDTHRFLHPGCGVTTAALAVGEKHKVSGQEFMVAVVAGYDVAIRISLAVGLSHRYRGFHPTATCNSFGAAVASGKLMGFTEEQLVNALGITATLTSGITQYRYDGSRIKHLHGGRSAQNGVMAALLTKEGFSGPLQGVEGKFGFCRVLSDECDLNKIEEGLGEVFEIANTDLKPYPSCRQTHNPVDLTISLVSKHDIPAGQIAKIEVMTYDYTFNCEWLIETGPCETPLEAMLNIPYCMAAAAKDQVLTLASFTEDKLKSPEIQDIARKIEFHEDKDYSQSYPDQRNCLVRITTIDGKTYEAHAINAKGHRSNPMSKDEIICKFQSLSYPVLGEVKGDKVVSLLSKLEEVDNIAKLSEMLSIG